MNPTQKATFSVEELQQTLEPLLRKIIREEITKVAQEQKNIFYMSPEMPLYKDMEEISERKEKSKIKLYSHEEVWDE